MNQLETGIVAALWHDILHPFHGNSQVLQSADQNLNSAVAVYECLIKFIRKLRERFEEFWYCLKVWFPAKQGSSR